MIGLQAQTKSNLPIFKLCFIFVLGISSGLPLLTSLDMLKAWLKDLNVELGTIGLSSLFGLPYTLKFLWSPLFDLLPAPFKPLFNRFNFSNRKNWILCTQLAVCLSLFLVGNTNPLTQPIIFGLAVFFLTFSSASQDIVLDAYRREIFLIKDFGLGNSIFISGYRVGMLISGPLTLSLANTLGWSLNYLLCSFFMLFLMLLTVFIPSNEEPKQILGRRKFFKELLLPLKDFFSRENALLFFAFVFLYKVGDMLASVMTIPFYKELGYSNEIIGQVAKVFGLVSQIIGGFVGGFYIRNLGIYRSLLIFGFLQALGILGFSLLYYLPLNYLSLGAIVSLENLSIGLGTTAFVTCIGALCRREFSATQYALLSSLSGVPRTVLGASTGYIAKSTGWPAYFIFCFLMSLPGLWLVVRLKSAIYKEEREAN
jgi:MFS transporter, PAT family, beta-lactamase induction signal transducer AmpG